jgi:Abortive infection C-terminus
VAEKGSLGPLSDDPSPELRNALELLVTQAEAESVLFGRVLYSECVKYFGWPEGSAPKKALRFNEVSYFLDFLEIFCEQASRRHAYSDGSGCTPMFGAEGEMNDLFDRHRFGYRLHDGKIVKIGSPALDEVVMGPALLAVERPGWEEVERSFREAIDHQWAGADENDDALTAANAAVEAALKAAGFKGANLGPLSKSFKNSDLVPPELRGVPEALDSLLSRSMAIRSSHGDSHGKSPGAAEVPQELADLAVHWAGAFIVYLSRAVPAP